MSRQWPRLIKLDLSCVGLRLLEDAISDASTIDLEADLLAVLDGVESLAELSCFDVPSAQSQKGLLQSEILISGTSKLDPPEALPSESAARQIPQ